MAELEILIKTRAELAGAEAALQTLERQIGAAKATGESYDALAAKRDRAQGAIADYQKSAIPPQIAAPTPLGSKIEFDAAQGTAKSLESQIGVAKATGESYAVLEQKLTRVNAAIATYSTANPGGFLDGLNNQLRESIPGFARLETGLSAMTAGPLGYVAAGFVALGAAFKVAAAGVREYAEAEQGVVARDQALAQRGLLTDSYRESLSGLADEMRNLTGIDDDRWTAAITRLTQFGADSGNMSASVEAVKNLAGIMKGDLQGASEAVSRALQGNFMMFSRLGIHLSETGTKTEKLAELYKKLADIGGGQLEARTHTLSGQYDKLKVSIGEVTKGIGAQIAHTGVIQKALEFAGNAAEYWGEKMAAVIPQAAGLQNATTPTTGAIEDQGEAAKKATEKVDKWKTAMSDAADAAKKLEEATKAKQSHEDKVDDLKRQLALLSVDARLKSTGRDRISEAEGVKEKFRINDTFDKRKEARDLKVTTDQAKTKETAAAALTTEANTGYTNVVAQEKRAKQVEDYEAKARLVASAEAQLKGIEDKIAEQQRIATYEEAQKIATYEKEQHGNINLQLAAESQIKRLNDLNDDAYRAGVILNKRTLELGGMKLPPGAKSAAEERATATRMDVELRGRAPKYKDDINAARDAAEVLRKDAEYKKEEFGLKAKVEKTKEGQSLADIAQKKAAEAPGERRNPAVIADEQARDAAGASATDRELGGGTVPVQRPKPRPWAQFERATITANEVPPVKGLDITVIQKNQAQYTAAVDAFGGYIGEMFLDNADQFKALRTGLENLRGVVNRGRTP